MLEQAGKQSLVFREGDDAVAHVAGRKHVKFFAEASAGSAVVADGDDSAEFGDLRGARPFCGAAGANHVALKAFQQGREASAAADGDDIETTARGCLPS